MTIVAPPSQASPETEDLAAAQRRWEAAESTRSTLTVFSIVLAGMALVASIIAIGFASTRTTRAAAPPLAPLATSQMPISLSEYAVGLPATTVTAGAKTLVISNRGVLQHEVLVFHPAASIDPNALPVDANGNVIEEAPGINKVSDGDNLAPGSSQNRSFDLSQPGTYVFVCNLPGHYKLGMQTVVKVV
jgi:uncharacterized cupredoxin-like copper-binding protein